MFNFGFLSKAEKEIRNRNIETAVNYLTIISDMKSTHEMVSDASIKLSKFFKSLTPERHNALVKKLYSDSAFTSSAGEKFNLPPAKSNKEIFFHFFGMDENWPIWRSLFGAFLVHSPEYPTYTIPAYTQAAATGDASELKKGEGFRGVITGLLEGVAVGALVSGKKLKGREMIPYMLLGAGLQFFSSKFFPWISEKIGRRVYLNKMAKNGIDIASLPQKGQVGHKDKQELKMHDKKDDTYSDYMKMAAFKSQNTPYPAKFQSSGLKV